MKSLRAFTKHTGCLRSIWAGTRLLSMYACKQNTAPVVAKRLRWPAVDGVECKTRSPGIPSSKQRQSGGDKFHRNVLIYKLLFVLWLHWLYKDNQLIISQPRAFIKHELDNSATEHHKPNLPLWIPLFVMRFANTQTPTQSAHSVDKKKITTDHIPQQQFFWLSAIVMRGNYSPGNCLRCNFWCFQI